MINKIGIGLAGIFIVLQFFQPKRNQGQLYAPGDITQEYAMPAEIKKILKASCYDCHSNTTDHPWYYNIQPAGWLLAEHIRDGKAELNLAGFANYSTRKKLSKLKAMVNAVEDRSMPLPSYTFMHRKARLSDKERRLLMDWTLQVIDSLEMHHN